MPLGLSLPSRGMLVTLSLVPVVVPAVYLLVVQAVVSRYVGTSSTQTLVLSKKDKDLAAPPRSLPAELSEPDAPYVVVYERVISRSVPAGALTVPALAASSSTSEPEKTASLLTAYLRGTMEAFSWTPQGLIMRKLIADPAVRRTFDADYLQGLSFGAGDLACGAYKVAYRETVSDAAELSVDRAELSLVPIAERPDLVVHAVIVAEVQRTAMEALFINETWMWRHAQDEKPSMLESTAGRWIHSLVGGWMVFKGTKTVTAPTKTKSE